MRTRWLAIAAVWLLLCGGARAEPAAPGQGPSNGAGVRLECLPDADGGADWRDWLRNRLALRGLDGADAPAWRLCFAEEIESRWVAQPPDWGYDGYWRQPPYRIESWPVLTLSVRGVDGSALWSGRERLGSDGNRRARLEQAAQRLLERMPLP
ncbi:hypothetical protein CXB49_05050 [Chromobacterium sp. ATCC 53434]|uniref:hypothetical protein n=1 Tax=Chromobacterium TaxID=535 RepID=UPI000C78F125|nr:hypothetical protein [Chromobacterium sp. ATCC 53434]AUH50231.1 hypothetical protein CXB49_05050 [Chromobacterium sp. ATCC 53434]